MLAKFKQSLCWRTLKSCVTKVTDDFLERASLICEFLEGSEDVMQSFPAVDPIPLPAPIWLFKLLHIVTLALHFVAVEMLLGGLLLAVILSAFKGSTLARTTAGAIARRLTVVMTFVINLGVPPLLFAQVLYGRALYTSSVLIGVYWISIIAILTLLYWLLYRFSYRIEAGKGAVCTGTIAWLLAGVVAKLLSTNMTLMLRPEVWQQMYSNSGAGVYLPTGDPTLFTRWATMMTGGLFIGGLWIVYLATKSTFTAEAKKFMAGLGGKVAAVFGILYLIAGLWAKALQPGQTMALMATHPLYSLMALAGTAWLALVVVGVLLAAVAGLLRLTAGWFGWALGVLALLIELTLVIYRDAIRDVTLLTKGFNVWDRVVVTNWSVVCLFLLLFVGGLGVIGWLISVVARAKKEMEGAAA